MAPPKAPGRWRERRLRANRGRIARSSDWLDGFESGMNAAPDDHWSGYAQGFQDGWLNAVERDNDDGGEAWT